jgi:hypothetical protein
MLRLAELVPVVEVNVGLAKNASQGADAAGMSHVPNVATFPTRLDETSRFQPALDLTEGLGA